MTGAAGDRRASEILTFLIADVRGYTSFTRSRGDEAGAHLAATFAEIAREGVEAFDGEVIELRGDEALAVFSSARQALRAATELQLAFVDETEIRPQVPLRVGIGLDAGEAVPVEGGYRGGALNLAARLCSSAGPGEVIASQGVVHLSRAVEGLGFLDGGALDLKGMAEPVPVVHVVREGSEPGDLLARLDRFTGASGATAIRHDVPLELDTGQPLVGADRERAARRLRWTWRMARRGAGSLRVIAGDRGTGKTRLAADAAALAAGDGARVLYASGTQAANPLSETVEEALEATTPTLVVADDLDAAEPEGLSLLPALVGSIGDHPVLLIGTMRDAEAGGPLTPLLRATMGDPIVLRPLGPADVAEIAVRYASDGQSPPVETILEASRGVPLEIHRLASEWARGEAARRLGDAAARAAASRQDLRTTEADLADTVLDLQVARERSARYRDEGALIDGTRVAPYKGLASFEADDADVFFGRERLVAEMVGRLAGSTLLGVVGPSGSGKSSAVRAGLTPALASGVLPGSEDWLRVIVRPGAYPLRALDRAVWAGLSPALRALLEGAEMPLRAARAAMHDGERVLVVVDQFEELFTQCDDEDERSAFVRALVEAAEDRRANALVILAVRADFYGRCAAYPNLADLLGASQVLVGPMTAEEYARAITGPARRSGLHVEPALVDSLVDEVAGEPGALPLLSSALLELWQRRRGRTIPLEAHRQTGGVRGAVGRLGEEAYGRLEPDDREVARALMLRLAEQGDSDAVVRRRVPLEELDTERNERVARVVDVFTGDRLITVTEGALEVSHEALLREWPRLRSWLEEDRAGQRLHAHLIEAAKGWDRAERDPGELYRGARLASALDWTAEHAVELNDLEREFVVESRAAAEAEGERQRRTNRRLRGLLIGAAVFLALALVAGGLALVQRGKADEAAQVAVAKGLGAQAVVEDELDTSLLLAREALAIDDSVDTRSTLLASLLKAPGAIAVLPGTGDRVLKIQSSTDGSIVATSDNIGGIAIYDSRALELIRTVAIEGGQWLAVAPDGATVATVAFGSEGQSLALISTSDGSVQTFPMQGGELVEGEPIAFAPDGSQIVTLERDPAAGVVSLVRRDPSNGALIRADPLPMPNPDTVAFSPVGDRVLIASVDPAELWILDAVTLESVRSIRMRGWPFDISADGRKVALGNDDGTVTLVDVATGARTPLEGRHTAMVSGVGFSPDGSTLVTTGDDRDVIVWDLETLTLREILHGHAGRPFGPAFDGSGATAFTVSLDGRVIAWDLTSGRRIGRRFDYADPSLFDQDGDLIVATSPDGSFAFSPDGGRISMTPGDHGAAWEKDPWTDEQFRAIAAEDPAFADADTDLVTSLAFSPDDLLLAVSGQHGQVVTYDAANGDEIARWTASEIAWVNSLAFGPDGVLVTANDDGRVASWDPRTGDPVDEIRVTPRAADMETFSGAVARAVPSPDGSRIAVVTYVVGGPQELMVLDARTGDVVWDGVEPDLWNSVFAWAPDGRSIATGGWQSGELNVWDAATGDRRATPVRASAGFVLSVDFAWDGGLIVTGATDGTVRLFDAATLKQVGANILADDNVWALASVLPRDEMLVLSFSGHAWRWDLDPARWAEQACAVANRNLTRTEWEGFLPDRPYAPSCPG